MRISYELLNKLKNLSNKEMDFFLYLAKAQNMSGKVIGVYHVEVCKNCNMSKQSFYNVLYSLAAKNIIQYIKNDTDYDVILVDNNFIDTRTGAFRKQKSYINLHKYYTHMDEFQHLKSNEKYLLFCVMKVTFQKGRILRIGFHKFFQDYCKELGIAVRTLRAYLYSLKAFFDVKRILGIYQIKAKDIMEVADQGTQDQREQLHIIETLVRRAKLKAAQKDIIDTAGLIKQYRDTATLMKHDIVAVLQEVMCYSRTTVDTLEPKYIHTLVRKVLEMPSN